MNSVGKGNARKGEKGRGRTRAEKEKKEMNIAIRVPPSLEIF
jgi:hypothetical protein